MKTVSRSLTVFDVVLTIFFTVLSFSLGLFLFLNTSSGDLLKVTANGEEYLYQMNVDRIITVKGAIGDTVIEIKNGKYRFVDSACQNKTCVKSGWTNSTIIPVTCLPNRVQAVVVSSKKKVKIEIDGVSM